MIVKQKISGSNVRTYLKNELDKSSKTLSTYVSKLNLDDGEVFALVPQGVSEKSLYEFENGGLYKEAVQSLSHAFNLIPIQNEARPFIIDLIYNYIEGNENNCCLLEETIGSLSDTWVKKSKIEFVYLRDEMFYYFDIKNNEIEKIKEALKKSESYYSLFALSSYNNEEDSKHRPIGEIRPEFLEEFVSNIVSFFVRAYDGEGYLMWNRS